MEIKTITDCWSAIRSAKTISEVDSLIESFPRWAGDWDIQIETNSFMEKTYVVYNTIDDDRSCETLSIEVEEFEESED